MTPDFSLSVITPVIALDNNPTRLALARHNAAIYGVADRIEFILADYPSFVRSYLSAHNPTTHGRVIDVVFLSPPWGGPSYLHGPNTEPTPELSSDERPAAQGTDKEPHEYSLSSILPLPGPQLFHLSRRITPNIAFYLPRNANLVEIAALVPSNSTSSKGKGKARKGGVQGESGNRNGDGGSRGRVDARQTEGIDLLLWWARRGTGIYVRSPNDFCADAIMTISRS